MACCSQLDAPRRARSRVIAKLFLALTVFGALCGLLQAQDPPSDATRLAAARAAFDAGHWEEAARLAEGPAAQSPDLDFLAGLAFARLERWKDARAAFEAGHFKSPRDARFLVELAGVAYKQKDWGTAKSNLRAALHLHPDDAYAREFLGTLYFLEGNLEAALKYWNAVDKPRLGAVDILPKPKLRQQLLDNAVTFNAPQVLTSDALAETTTRLENLGIFPQQRVELAESSDGQYDATLHLNERNGWGNSPLESIVSLLSGLPYDTVYPEYYNLGREAVNFTSLARWDPQKRRYSASLSTPLFHDPALNIQFYFDARDENWNISQTFFSSGVPTTDLNMRRIAGGVELHAVVNGSWKWSTGIEVAQRSFRNLEGHTSPAELPFFSGAVSFAYWLRTERSLLRIPESRFTLDSSAEARVGRSFNDLLGPFATARGSLHANWLPRAQGDDYEMQAQVRAGGTVGRVPLDELFQLGLERDNDLWLRGEPGTTDGRKGAAPLGRRYFLTNWEMDKNIYRGGLFNVKLGPLLDDGAVADSSGLFGSRRWLVDAGAQCKIRILGSVTVVLSYGRDLRGGPNVYYGTVLR
jgi:tetratricopeptide (TPR) repeat protein